MKHKKLARVLALLFMFLLSAMLQPVAATSPDTLINMVAIGETFTIDIAVSDIVDLYTWQASVIFNPDVLKCTGVVEGPFLKQEGTTFWIGPDMANNTAEVIGTFGCSLTGSASGVSGSGVLAKITFLAIDYGTPWLNITNVGLLDSKGLEIPFAVDERQFNTVTVHGLGGSQRQDTNKGKWNFSEADT